MSLVSGLLWAHAAGATNFVTNGTFDTNTDGWTGGAWSSLDAGNSPSSGSLFLATPGATGTDCRFASQCIRVIGGETYTLNGRIYLATGVPGSDASLGVAWYSDTDCKTVVSGQGIPPIVTALQVWTAASGQVVAPPAAFSAAVVGSLCPDPGGLGPASANFDDIAFTAPIPPFEVIPAVSTWGLAALALLLGGGAVWLLRAGRAFGDSH